MAELTQVTVTDTTVTPFYYYKAALLEFVAVPHPTHPVRAVILKEDGTLEACELCNVKFDMEENEPDIPEGGLQ